MSVYLANQKSKGKVYIVLKKSFRQDGKVYSKHLYSFGPAEKALDNMYWLLDNPYEFPEKLIAEGFDYFFIKDWIFDYLTKQPTERK